MMGEYVLYLDGVVIGGIYDDRLLLKKFSGLERFGMSEAIPYKGGKAMWLVDCVDDAERPEEIVGGDICCEICNSILTFGNF